MIAVKETVKKRRLFGPDDHVLVALSGGPDSTALLAALAALERAGELARLSAVHVDHGLRPGSAAEADACAELCARLDVAFHRRAVEVARGNVQSRARLARYAALRAVALEAGATRIATGHTRTDQAETVLHRLLRGAGARGLGAIPPKRGLLVRPLLDRSRAEVRAFLRDEGLPWLEDPSNESPRYTRNRIRRELLPALARFNPAFEEALARTADLLRDDDRALERIARREAGALAWADARRVRVLPLAVRRRAVRRLWKAATGSRRGLSASHVEAVLGLFDRAGPGRISLPGDREACLGGDRLWIGRQPEEALARRRRGRPQKG
ncbi:tRNA lysidine(34) synthetase TilS [Anaeromyxobacter paludicola]|uniref:tRNA lysidine(34) synthetase TilS n=1 Tax=Anaeromyxobacter paludicola TaxID=2918171 RepID=UPI0020BE742F|nr:tRNA lysidine(34) synthetase TilS [Anaeromyxobacter paludicola]